MSDTAEKLAFGCLTCGLVHRAHLDRDGCPFCRELSNSGRSEWADQWHSRVDGHQYKRPAVEDIFERLQVRGEEFAP